MGRYLTVTAGRRRPKADSLEAAKQPSGKVPLALGTHYPNARVACMFAAQNFQQP